jgi:hypothetical protein
MKTRIYYEREGNAAEKSRVLSKAADMVIEENIRFDREQIAARYIIQDLRIQRAYDYLSIKP